MKILLFTDYGTHQGNEIINEFLNKKEFPLNRTGDIIEYVENNAISDEDVCMDEIVAFFQNNKETVVKITGKENKYLVWNKDINYISTLVIKEVNDNIPWTIKDDAGAEKIEYVDYKLYNENLNYWKKDEV